MSSEMIWFIALSIVVAVAFYAGMDYGSKKTSPSSETYNFHLEKYKIDKEYEHKRWLEERKGVRHEERPDSPQE